MALRLQRVLGLLIHPNLIGFMTDWFNGDAVQLEEDSLEVIKEHHVDRMIVALDFSKTFDSGKWSSIS